MHYYQFNIADYRKDTAHLSLIEHAIYRSMLDLYYLNECELCGDDAKLMRSLCVRSADEVQAYKNVTDDFFVKTENGYFHKKCNKELQKIYDKSEKARLSALKRWEGKRTHSERNANGKLPTTQHPTPNNLKPKQKVNKAKPKNADEVTEYAKSIGFLLCGQDFIDYQDTRGWKLKGGQIIKDWKACIRTWKRNNRDDTAIISVDGVVEDQIALKLVELFAAQESGKTLMFNEHELVLQDGNFYKKGNVQAGQQAYTFLKEGNEIKISGIKGIG